MGINKVALDGNALIDLTQDTVAADKLLTGYTAHDSNGDQIVGTYSGGQSISIATGTFTSTGSSRVEITHNLGKRKLLIIVQAQNNSHAANEYSTMAGSWITDELVNDYCSAFTYTLGANSISITPDITNISGGHSFALGTSSNVSAGKVYHSPSGNMIINNCPIYSITDNSVTIKANYSFCNGATFNWVVFGF